MAIINGRGRVGIRRPSVVAGPSIVLDGLKLYLDASKTTSYPGTGTVWTDLSGNGNNGTLNGAVFNGDNGGNIQFDGINDSVIIPNNLTFTTSMTVDICFRSIKSARHHIVNFGIHSGVNSLNFDINDGANKLWIYWNDSGTNSLRYTTPSLSDGAIRNLTFVHNNNVNTVYINGSVLTGGSVIGTQTFTSISGNIYLGSGGSSVYTQGNIYNFKVYDRALSAAEVLQNYNASFYRLYPVVSDADAQAFVYAAGLTSSVQASAVNALVTSLKSAGIWTKMKAIYPFVGGSAASHKWNLKDPRDLDAAFRLTFGGTGWVHSSTGAKPNGSDYANTFLVPSSSLQLNSTHLSYYSRTNSDISNSMFMGVNDSNSRYLNFYTTPTFLLNGNMYTNSSTVYSQSIGNTLGLIITNRVLSSSVNAFKNNVKLGTYVQASTGLANSNIFISSRNSLGASSNYSIRECAFASIGDGLTDSEASSLYTAVQAFQTSLGRQV